VINVFKVLSALDISENASRRRSLAPSSKGASWSSASRLGLEVGRKARDADPRQRHGVSKLEDSGLRPKLGDGDRNLVTQPNGCSSAAADRVGQTTTLVRGLREIDRFQKNIITVEDPIEYHLDNINPDGDQHQDGQTFAGSSARSCGRTPTSS